MERQEAERQFEEKYNSRINEIAKAIETGKTIEVAYDECGYYRKNPVFDLFKMYNIDLPLRTKGWINACLFEITENSYRYFKKKNTGDSAVFSGYLRKLREEIKAEPIEQKRKGNENCE